MRHFAITGIVTASWIARIISGSDMRATPPSTRMSAGTRSSAMTATAPASSATRACSAFTTSMITPPLSISARPVLTRIVPRSSIAVSLLGPARPAVLAVGEASQQLTEDGALVGVEVVEVETVDAGDVRLARCAQLRAPGGGQLRVADPQVLLAGDALDEARAFEPFEQPRDPRGREQHLLREVDATHPAAVGPREPEQHLEVVDRQTVRGNELRRELSHHGRVRPQEVDER